MENIDESSLAASLRRPSTSTSSRTSSWKRLEKNWSQIQVGHQGSYSVERLQLFHEYCQTTSFTRVISVCLFTPVPALLTALLIECLPLNSPAEGWDANWMFWIRVALMLMFIVAAGSWELNQFVPGHNISIRQQVFATVAVCAAQLGTFLLVAATLGFPVPFMWQLGAFTIGIYIPVLTRLIYGPALFTKGSILQQHHKKFQDSFAVSLTLIGIYPFCRVSYDLLPQAYRVVVVFILPIWKFGAKRFAVRMTRQVEDFIPELVAFSVDFFGSLFISVCMTTSGSFQLTALFFGVDLLHTLLKFREIYSSENVILRIIEWRRRTESSRVKSGASHEPLESADLLSVILEVLRSPSSFCLTPLDGVRLWASPPHRISERLYVHLKKLEASGMFGQVAQSSSTRWAFSKPRRRHVTLWPLQRTSVVPIQLGPGLILEDKPGRHSFRQASQSGHLVLHGLQLLFHCEYLVLVEYVECIVPVIFLVYKSALEQLPNVVYYPEGAGTWGTAAVANLLVFVTLEIWSLILLHIVLQRKFAFSPLYQLAFVLETQVYAVQATLFSLTLFVLQYQLEHLGRTFKQNEYMDKLERDLRHLRCEVEELRSQINARQLGNQPRLNYGAIARRYQQQFMAFVAETARQEASATGFLLCILRPEVCSDPIYGVEAILEDWRVTAAHFEDVLLEISDLKTLTAGILVGTTTTSVTISAHTLRLAFPHLNSDGMGGLGGSE